MTIKFVTKNRSIIKLDCGCIIEREKGKKDKFIRICFKHKD